MSRKMSGETLNKNLDRSILTELKENRINKENAVFVLNTLRYNDNKYPFVYRFLYFRRSEDPKKYEEILRLFVNNGVDINRLTNCSSNLLHIFCEWAGHRSEDRLSMRNFTEEDFLNFEYNRNKISFIRLLLLYGLNTEIKNEDGKIPEKLMDIDGTGNVPSLKNIQKLLVHKFHKKIYNMLSGVGLHLTPIQNIIKNFLCGSRGRGIFHWSNNL